jgi:hypothetical protein
MDQLIKEAVEDYGTDIVNAVTMAVNMSDADIAWSMFSDMELWDHVDCIEFLYFSGD